ncbi:MAG: OPT/YSL family transporter [Deltaproteobacteria bacterium]|nr:OPT/YSL family transporter [Deltaproteobacteria bacterium]
MPDDLPADAIDPAQVDQLDEAAWYARVYRGDQAQLTARAVGTGLALGFVLSFANVYVGLKTGWFFSMALAAGLGSFALWQVLAAIGVARRPLSLLETACMQSTASSAAYATGNMVVGVIPAMLLLSVSPAHPTGTQASWPALAAWIACIAALGVTLAIPLKRQLINRERLAFPSGTAAAIMLHNLHRRTAAVRGQARALVAAIGVGAALPLLRDLRDRAVIGKSSAIFDWLPRISAGGARHPVSDAGVVVDHSALLVAAGVFIGVRTALWMLIGGLVTALVIGPIAVDATWTDPLGHAVTAAAGLDTASFEVGIWIGAPMLVAYGLVALAGNWRAIGRTFARGGRDARDASDATSAGVEIPMSWFWAGFAGCGGAAIVLGQVLFDIPVALGALAVLMSLVFSLIACRITGETDVTPGGPMGKLTQLTFGALRPQHPTTNLMTAAMTHASSVAAADLLTDLKSGYLLGAHPRRQFAAQAIGILAGTAASVLAYFLLIPDASAITSTTGHPAPFAAPGAHQFRAIAVLLQFGLDHLHPMHRALVVIGAIAGVALAAIERLAPRAIARWLPSTAGLGLGLLLPVASSLAMAMGALAAFALTRRRADVAERYVWPISAGLLAGESLAGVLVAILNTTIL